MTETTGNRLYLIRLACGDGVRTPEPLDRFAERVREATGKAYNPMTLSLLERMKQGWRLIDVRALAAVDPLKRGATWLSALDVESEQAPAKGREVKHITELEPVPRASKKAAKRSSGRG
jgi:hypothetical protein